MFKTDKMFVARNKLICQLENIFYSLWLYHSSTIHCQNDEIIIDLKKMYTEIINTFCWLDVIRFIKLSTFCQVDKKTTTLYDKFFINLSIIVSPR